VVEEKEYLTDALTREAVSFIDRHKSHPFFLYVPYNAIHSPMQALAPETDRFASIADFHRRVFAGMLSSLDKGIGRILAKLHDSGLDENTLIFFLSDNGGPTQELTSGNQPLHGFKGQTFEGGIRIPFMAQWKGKIAPGQVVHDPVISMDIFATAAAASGVKPEHPLDGVDLLPYLTGRKKGAPHERVFWRYGLIGALRRGSLKIVRQGSESEFQLFDLAKDIGETRNLAAERPEILHELTAAWNQMNSQMVAPLWGPQRAGKKK
jgi:arylsulfatase B